MHLILEKAKNVARDFFPSQYAFVRRLFRRHIKACCIMGPLTYIRAITKYKTDFPEFIAPVIREGNYDFNSFGSEIPCFFLGSDRWLPLIFTSMYSMRYKGLIRVKYVLIEDNIGFTPNIVESYQKLFGMIRLIRKEEAEGRLDKELPRGKFPLLRKVRDEHILFKKLIDVSIIDNGWKLFLDADTMFFHEATELRLLMENRVPFSLFDRPAIHGYFSLPVNRLSHVVGLPITAKSGRCNTGLMGFDSRQIDWEWMEFCLGRVIDACGGLNALKLNPSRWWALEMTMYAVFFARCEEFNYLPCAEYVVSPDFQEIKSPKHVFTHYCGSREALFGYSAIRHVFG